MPNQNQDSRVSLAHLNHPLSAIDIAAPQDPIFSLLEQYRADPRPEKITLCAGVYTDDTGVNSVPKSVKQAEALLLEQETSKSYLSIEGEARYGRHVQELLLGAEHPLLDSQRVVSLHTTGGVGALRLLADLSARTLGSQTVWLSTPSWVGHKGLFQAARMKVEYYPYLDSSTYSLREEEMLAQLQKVSRGDVVVLQVCCHNPSGIDMTADTWRRITTVLAKTGALAVLDCAYQGFGDGMVADVQAIKIFAESGQDFVITYTLSKTMGIYRERTGALVIVCQNAKQARLVLSQAKFHARALYSNPPSHGGQVALLLLDTPKIKTQWEAEIVQMRLRIQKMRGLFAKRLSSISEIDFSPIIRQRGMFALTNLSPEHALTLRKRFGVYFLDSGRINVSALTSENLDYVVESIKTTLQSSG